MAEMPDAFAGLSPEVRQRGKLKFAAAYASNVSGRLCQSS
jgi:hypothetical protein